ncbi:uncharacterized protein [Cardiocondyla obscurior]|uniref:uncharacterized protein n=1 Tax=Cardiocondyla obscurior TaxID=286306 RepID=UPI003965811B
MDNLSILYTEIVTAFYNDFSLTAVFLNIQLAYDNVLADVLVHRLLRLDVPRNVCRFVFNLCSSRQATCRFGNIDEVFWLYKGLSQGSVLSSLLYTLYVTEIDDINSNDCRMLHRDNKAVRGIAPERGRGPERSRAFSVRIQDATIYNSTRIKFLGLTFQSNLSWSDHINRISSLGAGSNLPKSLLLRLDRVKCQGLRLVMGYRRSTPLNIIFYESKEPPSLIRSVFLARNFFIRVALVEGNVLLDILKVLRDLTERVRGQPLSFSESYEALTFKPKVNLVDGDNIRSVGASADDEFRNIFANELKSSVCLFTDGSKIEDLPFAGFLIVSEDNSVSLRFRTADSRSALSAIGAAFNHRKSSYLILRIKALMLELIKDRNASVNLV